MAAGEAGVRRAHGHWIDEDGAPPLLGWLSSPDGRCSTSGVLVLPPIGYAYWSAYWTIRTIAERLAANGHLVLRIDYLATGDSSGDQWDENALAAWRASIVRAARELRHLGCLTLTLVGVQLGGTLALIEGAAVEADAAAVWAPVVSGRRYARELRARSLEVPAAALPAGVEGAMVLAGTVFTNRTLAEFATLDATQLSARPAARALVVDGAPQDALADQLATLGVEVDHRQIGGGETALAWAAEDAIVPEEIVETICSWIGAAEPEDRELPPLAGTARISCGGEAVTETVVELGPTPLVGIMTEPADPAAPRRDAATVVFLNSGAEPHTGPGRAWVEYARGLALRGHRCLRVDYRGWGESPDDGHAPARLYEPHCEDDTVAIIRALRDLGHERIVLVGLCASAWMALRAVLREPVAGVIALNPQMYWRQGDPVEALLTDTRARRTAERRRHDLGERAGLWTMLDVVGHRPWAGRWLDDLAAIDTPIAMLFAEGDDGIEFLRTRLNRRLRHVTRPGRIRVVEIPEIDHSMHRAWLRPKLIDILNEQVEQLTGISAENSE